MSVVDPFEDPEGVLARWLDAFPEYRAAWEAFESKFVANPYAEDLVRVWIQASLVDYAIWDYFPDGIDGWCFTIGIDQCGLTEVTEIRRDGRPVPEIELR